MNGNNKGIITIPIGITVLVAIFLFVYSMVTGKVLTMRTLLVLSGGALFFSFVLTLAGYAYIDIFKDFISANRKGRIIIATILLLYVLRAIYQMSLSK
jgi:hypothetical protein